MSVEIRLPADLYEFVERYAKEHNMTKEQVVWEACKESIRSHDPQLYERYREDFEKVDELLKEWRG